MDLTNNNDQKSFDVISKAVARSIQSRLLYLFAKSERVGNYQTCAMSIFCL